MAEHPYTAWQFWSEQASSAPSSPWPVAGAYPSEVAAASALQPRIEYLCKSCLSSFAEVAWAPQCPNCLFTGCLKIAITAGDGAVLNTLPIIDFSHYNITKELFLEVKFERADKYELMIHDRAPIEQHVSLDQTARIMHPSR